MSSAQDQAFIEDFIRRNSCGDDKCYQTAVVCETLKSAGLFTRDQKVELQTRTLVLGRYRLFLFPTGKDAGNAKKVVDVKYLDIVGIDCEAARLCVRTANPVSDLGQVSLRTDKVRDTVVAFATEWRRSFVYIPLPPITNMLDTLPTPDLSTLPRSTYTAPYLAAYAAWCNYYDSPASIAFMNHVEDLELRGSTDLDLRDCPGIEPSSDNAALTLNLIPVFAALRFDCYFNAIIISGMHKQALSLVGDAVRSNSWLTKVVVVDTGADQDALVHFSSALAENKIASLQMIDISQHPGFGDRGLQALSAAFAVYAGRLTHVRLANIGASGRGICQLFSAFRINYRLSLGIQYLNLNGNKFDAAASARFEEWCEKAGPDSQLQTLCLGSTGITLTNLSKLRMLRDLQSLDLSESKVDSIVDARLICSAFEGSPTLTSVDLSGCGFGRIECVETVFSALSSCVSPMTLKLSHNAFGQYTSQDLSRFCKALSGLYRVCSLDLSGMALKDETQLMSMLDALKLLPSLHTLLLDYVRLKPKSLDFILSLWALPALTNISMISSFGPEATTAFFKYAPMPSQRRLMEIDVSQNQMGDAGAEAITGFLRHDEIIQSLKCDGNGFSISGWGAILTALRLTSAVNRLSQPLIDLMSFKVKSTDDAVSAEYLNRRLVSLSFEMQLLASRSKARTLQNVRVGYGEPVVTSQLPTPTAPAPGIAVGERLLADTASYVGTRDEDVSAILLNPKLSFNPILHRPVSVTSFDPSVLVATASEIGDELPPALGAAVASPGSFQPPSAGVGYSRPPSVPQGTFLPTVPANPIATQPPVSTADNSASYNGNDQYNYQQYRPDGYADQSGYEGQQQYNTQPAEPDQYSELEKARPGLAATSAAAVRQRPVSTKGLPFGTIGGAGFSFDTFRLPVDPAELAAMEASIPAGTFEQPGRPTSQYAGPPKQPPKMPILAGVHKPPPGLAVSTPMSEPGRPSPLSIPPPSFASPPEQPRPSPFSPQMHLPAVATPPPQLHPPTTPPQIHLPPPVQAAEPLVQPPPNPMTPPQPRPNLFGQNVTAPPAAAPPVGNSPSGAPPTGPRGVSVLPMGPRPMGPKVMPDVHHRSTSEPQPNQAMMRSPSASVVTTTNPVSAPGFRPMPASAPTPPPSAATPPVAAGSMTPPPSRVQPHVAPPPSVGAVKVPLRSASVGANLHAINPAPQGARPAPPKAPGPTLPLGGPPKMPPSPM